MALVNFGIFFREIGWSISRWKYMYIQQVAHVLTNVSLSMQGRRHVIDMWISLAIIKG